MMAFEWIYLETAYDEVCLHKDWWHYIPGSISLHNNQTSSKQTRVQHLEVFS